ncbi:phosphopyruvate hydratase [Patescibacteria group bacterium]|nr:phosphopyruvate hydratase [Patescibacteria group bacterium]
MPKIKEIIGREIYDSRGTPTVECDVILEDGSVGRSSVPSGASRGNEEAWEKRDGGERLNGLGVKRAVEEINSEIKKELIGMAALQSEIDQALIDLDGTKNKKRLGANAMLAVSVALLKAAAVAEKLPLYQYIEKISKTKTNRFDFPCPQFNVINGGKHAKNNLDFQEFLIIPMGAKSVQEAMEMGGEVYLSLKKLLLENNLSVGLGDEGGFAPNLRNNEEAITYLVKAIEKANYKPGKDIFLGLDVAANSFYEEKEDLYLFQSQYKKRDRAGMIKHFGELSKKYPLISIEDPLVESDFEGWQEITQSLGAKIQIVGDDFFVTNPQKISRAAKKGEANSVLIKPNQIGTISEVFEAIKVSEENSYIIIVSHRSGDTEDSFIADLSFGIGAKQIKSGSFSRSERMCKYNQLLRIEEDIKKNRSLSSFRNKVYE